MADTQETTPTTTETPEVVETPKTEETPKAVEETKEEYWPGSKSASKPTAVALPVQCCVKLDEEGNVIGGFVKNGPCMVKSLVVPMSKADCEAVGKGSLLEMQTVKTDSGSNHEEGGASLVAARASTSIAAIVADLGARVCTNRIILMIIQRARTLGVG